MSLFIAPFSIEDPTSVKVILEDPIAHYQQYLRTEFTNNVVFGAPVIKGFKELITTEIFTSVGEKIVYNTESLNVTIDLGKDFKWAPAQDAERKITVDSSVWRNTGYVVRYKLESNEDVRVTSGTVTVKGELGRSVMVSFEEEGKVCVCYFTW